MSWGQVLGTGSRLRGEVQDSSRRGAALEGQPLFAALAALGANQFRHLRLHHLLHDPTQRLAQKVDALLLEQKLTTRSAVILFVSAIAATPFVEPWRERRV
jgi:hypothetical protein